MEDDFDIVSKADSKVFDLDETLDTEATPGACP